MNSVQKLMPLVPVPAIPSSMTQEARALDDTSHCNYLQLNDPPHATVRIHNVHTWCGPISLIHRSSDDQET
jgi:hypothetical protein